MAADIVPELMSQITTTFDGLVTGDKKIASILGKIADGRATQADIHRYSVRLGELLSETLTGVYGASGLPDGILYYNIAERTIIPSLHDLHERTVDLASAVQTEIDAADGIGLGSVNPDFATDRAMGLVDKVGGMTLEEAAPWLNEPLINFAEKVADDFIFSNARARYSAGFAVTVSRRTSSFARITPPGRKKPYEIPCRWCDGLQGDYNYNAVYDKGNDIWRRHEKCRCVITYHNDRRAVNVNHQTELTSPAELLERLSYNTEIFRR